MRRRVGDRRLRQWLPDLLGVSWVLAAGLAMLLPALVHGVSLGPFDLLSRYGLSKHAGVVVQNRVTLDQITEMMPWTALDWIQVHQGHLPIWNPYEALGMPLAFNWQSAPFSVPTLVSYLFPLRLAYTVSVMLTLAIAGTGVYVLGRMMRLGVIASVMAATVYELSGPIVGWLGWPMAGVMAWGGWLFAAALLVTRGRRRALGIAALALTTAAAIYAGQPEGLVLLGGAFVLFVVVLMVLRARLLGGSGPIARPTFDLVVGGAAGLGLGAPLLLPGTQLLPLAIRTLKGGNRALPLSSFVELVNQGFSGQPVAGSRYFGFPPFYHPPYMGVFAVVFAIAAVVLTLKKWRLNHEVLAFAVVGLAMLAVVFSSFLEAGLLSLPSVGNVIWRRADVPMSLAFAVLAGVGADFLVKSGRLRQVRRAFGLSFAGTGTVIFAWWLLGRGNLASAEGSLRARSFVWPAAQVALGLLVVGALTLASRSGPDAATGFWRGLVRGRGRGIRTGVIAASACLVCETAFLITVGAPLFSSSPTFFRSTASETDLLSATGSSLVGFGNGECFSGQLGIVPNVNAAMGLHELAIYDPLLPRAYDDGWQQSTGEPASPPPRPGQPFSIFCPAVANTAFARLYGVGFILEPHGVAGPPGTVFVAKIGDELLYRVPGAASATSVALGPGGGLPGPYAAGKPVEVAHTGPASWKLSTVASKPQVLRLRLADVPGWHATIDGRPLSLERFAGIMLQARVPAGRHAIVLHYWPDLFSVGLVVAVGSLTGLSIGLLFAASRRRRTEPGTHSPTTPT